MTFEELVKAVGPGFHPNNSGDSYETLPEGVTALDYDVIVSEAFVAENSLLAPSPYARALGVFEKEGWA